MTSNIDVTFPIVGIDQPSQGFRDNFAAAKNEIEALQAGKIEIAIAVTGDPGSVMTGSGRLTLSGDPIGPLEAATKQYVDSSSGPINIVDDVTPQLGANLDVQAFELTTSTLNGDIVLNPPGTGSIDVATSRITNVIDPTGLQDASTKKYVDDGDALLLPLVGGTITGNLTVNGIVKLPGGSAAAPGVATSGDPDTGIFFDGNNGLGFSSGGVERVKVTSASVLSTVKFLAPLGSQLLPTYSFTGDLNTGMWSPGDDSIAFSANAEAMRITAENRVGIGTTTPTARLEVVGPQSPATGGFGSGHFQVRSSDTAENANAIITGHNSFGGNKQLWYFGGVSSGNADIALINRETTGELQLWTANTERVVVNSDGGTTFFGDDTSTSMRYSKEGGLTFNGTRGAIRMANHTTTTRLAITLADGLVVYDVTLHELMLVKNGVWVNILTS